MNARALGCVAGLLVASCGSHPPPKSTKLALPPIPRFGPDGGRPRGPVDPFGSVPSYVVTVLGQKSIGPFLARNADGGLVGFVVGTDSGDRQLAAAPVGPNGAPSGDARIIAKVPSETTALVMRAAGPTFFAAWSALLDRGEALSVAGINPDGTPRGEPVEVTRTSDHLVWMEIVPTARGGVCLWAEQTRGGDANLFAVGLDDRGRLQGLPTRIARGLTGWQAVKTSNGAGLALVFPDPKAADKAGAAGLLSWVRLDAEGRPLGDPVTIAGRPTISSDVDIAAVPGGDLLAWTDATGDDEEVWLATVDDGGHVQPPRRAFESVGGARLVGLASGGAGVTLAWGEPSRHERLVSRVHLARVALGPNLSAQSTVAVELRGRTPPELVATDAGFALLGTARACAEPEARCEDTDVMPTVVRFDAQLTPLETDPLRLDEDHAPATLAWDLSCVGASCVALVATSGTPTPVRTVDLSTRTSAFRPPLSVPPPAHAPRLLALKTLAAGDSFSDVAAARVGATTLLATLTADDPKTGGKVGVRVVDEEGNAKGPSQPLTTHGLAVGGVAIAAALKVEEGAAVAWVSRDAGDPQVHVARVDRTGRKMNEVQVTSSKGDASGVTLAPVAGGWIVAWVDGRDGNGEVYATKLDRELQRVGREERITRAPGDASDVAVVAQGDVAWIAWADPRESPKEGLADIYVTSVRARDARPASDEVRVLATAAHSHSPALALAGSSLVIGWIEDAPMGLASSATGPYGAIVTRLDPSGHSRHDPVRLPQSSEGRPTSVALEPASDGFHAIVARSTANDIVLDAVRVTLDGTAAGEAFALVGLDAPASFDTSLAMLEGSLFFDDEGKALGERRLRRAVVGWRQ